MTDQMIYLPGDIALRWIAQLFLRPLSASDLTGYAAADGQAFLSACKDRASLAALSARIEAATVDPAQAAEAFAAEFSRVFDQGGPRAALPYASVFLSENGLLYQAPTQQMNAILTQLSMKLPEGVAEPADHIAIQLQVAAELAEREAAKQALPLSYARFLREQLMTWLPAFAKRCAHLRNADLFAVAARAACDLVEEELESCLEHL